MDANTANMILVRVKQAAGEPVVDPVAAIAAANRAEAMRRWGQIAILGLGVGATARGATTLINKVTGSGDLPEMEQPEAVIPIPGKPRRRRLGSLLTKQAGGNIIDDALDAGKSIMKGETGDYKSWPAFLPGAALAGVGGTFAGWKGVDAVLDARRKREMDLELADAKKRFNRALLSQYRPIGKAAEDELGFALDELADTAEKMAAEAAEAGSGLPALPPLPSGPTGTAVDKIIPSRGTVGRTAGGYLTYAALSALIAGSAAYRAARKNSNSALLQKAVDQQERRRQALQPPEVFVTPRFA